MKRESINKIKLIYPDLNEEWLITGKGKMIKQSGEININADINGGKGNGHNISLGKENLDDNKELILKLNDLNKKLKSFTYCVNKGSELLYKYNYDATNNEIKEWIEYTSIMCEQLDVLSPSDFIGSNVDFIKWVSMGYGILALSAFDIEVLEIDNLATNLLLENEKMKEAYNLWKK